MIEWIFIISLIFIVMVIFYKQANEEFTILQLEGNQLVSLPNLLSEKYPIVIRQVQMPTFFTPEAIQQNGRIQTFPISDTKQLKDALSDATLTMPAASARILAQQVGLQVWAEHNWLPYISTWSFYNFIQTTANTGEQGLRKTTAYCTILLPTSQSINVTILTSGQEKFLPSNWHNTDPEAYTLNDTPLVGNIKFMVIKVKPGNCLVLPPHWLYTLRASDLKKSMLWCSMEIHTPLSWLASRLEENSVPK